MLKVFSLNRIRYKDEVLHLVSLPPTNINSFHSDAVLQGKDFLIYFWHF